MSTTPTNRTLSKGTMNLKFMNRVQPKPNIIESPVVAVAVAVVVPTVVAKVETVEVVIKEDVKMEGIESDSIASTSTQRRIIHESSLLSFPQISSSFSNSISKFTTTSNSYSSMPWTNTVISGRRSFGGANVEIEQLNNPSLVPIPDPSTSTSKDQSQDGNSKKKRKSNQSESSSYDDPRRNFSSSKNNLNASSPSIQKNDTSFQSNSDEIKLNNYGADKKQRTSSTSTANNNSKGFVKPSGFEDVKKKAPLPPSLSSKQSKKERKGKEVEPVWNSMGTERAWDVGKTQGGSDEDDDQDDESEDSEESDDDEDLINRLLEGRSGNQKEEKEKESNKKRNKFNEALGELFLESSTSTSTSTNTPSKNSKNKKSKAKGAEVIEEELIDSIINKEEMNWDLDEKASLNKGGNSKERRKKNRSGKNRAQERSQ